MPDPDEGPIPEGMRDAVDLIWLNGHAANQTRKLISETLADHQNGIDRAILQHAAINEQIITRAVANNPDPTP